MPTMKLKPEDIERVTAELVAKGATVVKSAAPAARAAGAVPRHRKSKVSLVEAAAGFGWWVVPLHVVCGDNRHTTTQFRRGRAGHERKMTHRTMATNYQDLTTFVEHMHRGGTVKAVLTRLGPRVMDWSNVVSSLKFVQDAIAERFGVDDADKRWAWDYHQEASECFGVRIEMKLV